MLKFFQAQKLGLKKIKFGRGKSLFVIVPIALMFAIIVVASSEAYNLINVAHNSIFSPIQSQNEVIELNKSSSFRPQDIFSDSSSTNYSATDTTLISGITNIEKSSLISVVPVSNVKTTDLFNEKTVTISSLAGLDQEYAKLYTSEDFNYTAGEPIPIILNANDFVESYEDWGGKTSISVDFTKAATTTTTETLAAQSPAKSKAISYNRNDLIGKTITVTIGGLDEIYDINQVSTSTGYTYTQKSQTDIDKEIATRKTAISKYWDYTKISTPLTYTFKVVGISEGNDKTKAYVPSSFASVLMQDYIGNELAARNKTVLPSTEYNATYLGLVYDGVTLTNDSTSSLYAGIRNQVTSQVSGQISNINSQIDKQNAQIGSANAQNQETVRNYIKTHGGPGGGAGAMPSFQSISSVGKLSTSSIKISYPDQATSYSIPGLVFTKNRTTNELTAEYKTVGTDLPLPSTTILVKLASVASRDQVVTDLNNKGYNYQDYSQYKQYDKLEGYLNTILNIASIIFMVVTALFILINMAKFVSEGRKEIGIFRAIGATKGDIRLLFILQTLSYILISLLVGTIVGVAAVAALSSVMVTSAQSFINQAVGSATVLNGSIVQSDFLRFNGQMILIYAGGLLVVSLIVSLIPSGQAARVSPVEAIRNS